MLKLRSSSPGDRDVPLRSRGGRGDGPQLQQGDATDLPASSPEFGVRRAQRRAAAPHEQDRGGRPSLQPAPARRSAGVRAALLRVAAHGGALASAWLCLYFCLYFLDMMHALYLFIFIEHDLYYLFPFLEHDLYYLSIHIACA